MTVWHIATWTGSADSVSHNTILAPSVPAGGVICYIEARVHLSVATASIPNTADLFMAQQAGGMAIGAVPQGSGAPALDALGESDGGLLWAMADSHQDMAIWAPNTGSGFWWPYFTTTLRWRGARRFPASMDWYFVSDSSETSNNQTHATGFFRLGFWDGTA